MGVQVPNSEPNSDTYTAAAVEVTDRGGIDQGSELLETGAGELRTSESVLELMAIRSVRIAQ